jgi:hypothetical protein
MVARAAVRRLARGAPGIVGMRSSHTAGGAGAVAESRKARFLARSAKKALKTLWKKLF